MSRFTGFSIPEGAWLPPEIIFLIPHLKESELKCLIIALYHYTQVGGVDALSLSDFERLSGLTSSSVSTALQTLIGNRPLRNGQLVQLLLRIQTGNSFTYEPVIKQINGLNFRPPGANFAPPGLKFRPPGDQLVKESVNFNSDSVKLTDSDSDSEEARAEMVRVLRGLGVNPRPMGEILGKHALAYIREKMAFYQFALRENLANGPGWLVSACRYNWGPPLGYVAEAPRGIAGAVEQDDEDEPEAVEEGEVGFDTPDKEHPATQPADQPLDLAGWNGVGMRPDWAWQSAVGQLQMEMPKATFDTWVRDAKFAGYDQGQFKICFYNAYARDWCQARLSSTLERILTGIMNQPVTLEFVA